MFYINYNYYQILFYFHLKIHLMSNIFYYLKLTNSVNIDLYINNIKKNRKKNKH